MAGFPPITSSTDAEPNLSRQSLLAQCIILVIVSTLLALISNVSIRSDVTPVSYTLGFGPFLLSYGFALFLVRRGSADFGAWVFMVGTFIGQLGVVMVADGYQGQALVSFVNLVLVAGFTMGVGVAGSVTVVAAALVSVHSVIDKSLIPTIATVPPNPTSNAITLAATIFTTGGLVIIGMRHFNMGMKRVAAASSSAMRSREIAEDALQESAERLQWAQILADLGGSLIELRTSDAVARICSQTLFQNLRVDQVLVLDENGFCVGQYPFQPLGGANNALQLDLKTERALTDDECRKASSLFVGKPMTTGYALSVDSSASHNTIVMMAAVPLAFNEAQHLFIETTGKLLGAALGRVIAEERLIRSQKMDVVDRLSSGIAHDLNNYLMAIVTGIGLIELKLARGQNASEHLALVKKTSDSASALMGKLTHFTQARRSSPKPIDIGRLLAELPLILTQSRDKRVTYDVIRPDQALWVLADPVDVEQIALNLLLNALDAVELGGHITLEIAERDKAVLLVVEDDGHGMADHVKDRIFEPFFSTRHHGGGSGLGLTMVFALVRGCGAEINLMTAPNEGTRFEIAFPRHPPPGSTAEEAMPVRLSNGMGRRILVVDDDHTVRQMLLETLREYQYDVTEAEDGTDAWALLTTEQPYDIVLTDIVMPGMRGHTLINLMRKNGIFSPAVVMTGFAPHQVSNDESLLGVTELRKPFSAETLAAVIDEVLSTSSQRASHMEEDLH